MPESALPITRLIAVWTLAIWTISTPAFACDATLSRADQAASGQGLGSIDEYERSAPRSEGGNRSHLLGIEVKNETVWLGHSSWLEHGRWMTGVKVLKVVPGSPGDAAGLQDPRPGVLHTTILITGLVAAAVFPPALVGVMALNKVTEPQVMIIAVDGERTYDVIDFEQAIEKAEAGELIYITVLNHGRREQIRVALPAK
jgi:hypothetical protein